MSQENSCGAEGNDPAIFHGNILLKYHTTPILTVQWPIAA
jgi:hypothetical protein